MSEITVKQTNRGTGAGGANTTANGIKLEEKTRNAYTSNFNMSKIIWEGGKSKLEEGSFNGDERKLIRALGRAGFKHWDVMNHFSKDNEDYKNRGLHGTKEPDDAFIDMVNKNIYWIECKAQADTGSVCEKLQTYTNKIRNLKERYPEYTIKYIYVLDQWFRKKCPWEIKYMIEDNITIVWNDENFEETLKSVIA